PAAALIGAFVFYALVIAVMELARIPETYAFELTTQGFVLLFGAAVVAYLRGRARRPAAWAVGVAALTGWAFLMSGFSWL
ncbi:hypothetical protein SB717_39080, partial [Priestia sp. SIMBA_032]|uniref:hypothetical protein n=1 Tax=Priestia sp. SIMBA_032 TaxID=3085775 RepID=UPI00397A08B8